MRRMFLAGLLTLLAAPALAQELPPISSDSRVQTVAWSQDGVIPLAMEPGSSLTVILSASERITNVTVGDTSAFQVAVAGSGDSLFVKPIAAFARTNMTVMTDARRYLFLLDSAGGPGSPYVVQLSYPAAPGVRAQDPTSVLAEGTWKVTGDRNLRPVEIHDDGVKTYIQWAPDQALPAVFAIPPSGGEEVVDGYMRDTVFVIDRVHLTASQPELGEHRVVIETDEGVHDRVSKTCGVNRHEHS